MSSNQGAGNGKLKSKLKSYKRKYYQNKILKGLILTTSILTTLFIIANSLEFSIRFSSSVRTIIFFVFIVGGIFTFYTFVLNPLWKFLDEQRGLSNEEAAKRIGSFFPNIQDKLLNVIQLERIKDKGNRLISASVNQKTAYVIKEHFNESIDFKANKRYLKFLVPPLVILVLLMAAFPNIITESTPRLVNFNKEFVPEAPFTFVIENKELLAFKNEDYTLNIRLEGSAIPQNVYLSSNGRKIKMAKAGMQEFQFTFQKIQNDKRIQFESAGFTSESYDIKVVNRPNLRNFNVHLDYPNYLRMQNERLNNVGNLEVPEGTLVKWQFNTLDADEMSIKFGNKEYKKLQDSDNQLFTYNKRFLESQAYTINLKNQYSENREKIIYNVNVIPDEYPGINLNVYQDTTLYNFLVLAGNVSDDHGLTRLKLFYSLDNQGKNQEERFVSQSIPLTGTQNSQSFYYQWTLDSLRLKEGDKINYYLQIWDNDGVNGHKSTKTGTYTFKIPTDDEIEEEIEAASKNSQDKIEETLENAKELQEKIDEAQNRLKGKQNLDWQDEQLLQELIERREELNKTLEDLKEQHKANNLKRERFKNQNENIREKVEQLQNLMDELLDEETKKLYEELQKLLEEHENSEDFQDVLDKLDFKEDNLEKELERTLELFKRMKFEYKLEETINEINELSEEQEELSEETGDKNNEEEDLMEEQQDLNEGFEEFQQSMEELQEMNQDLKNPKSMEDQSQENQEIEEQQQKSMENLQKGKRNKAQQNQKNASDQMKKLSKKLSQMQSNMQMSMMQANLDHLRDIVHNLLKLSFDQEKLMKEFREINQSDPRFVELSQKQLKLKDDAKIVEDSLLSLANRVFQIQSFVTREVGEMNKHMDASIEALRDRGRNVIPLTTSKQQFAMTSMNNLALLLDNVMSQMIQALAEAMGTPQKGQPNENSMPSMSELQKQLNEKIQQLKQSGKSGRELSEELAKLAAEQERIRKALQEAEEKLNQGQGDGGLEEIMDKMEETEIDLVNKQITKETIERQREILTRLLEAEESIRERELEEKREAETAKPYENLVPKAFEEYFKIKEKEIELLKTIPPKLYPYYKKEVNEYFKRIGGR